LLERKPVDAITSPDPVITETSTYEWVTMETDKGQERVLVPVKSIESVQTEQIASAKSQVGIMSSYTFEMWRTVSWTPPSGGNVNVRTKGSTSTSVTAEKIFVWMDHWYRTTPGSGGWTGTASNWRQRENTTTTGICATPYRYASTGWEHAAQGDHQAKVNGSWHIRNDEWGPQTVVP
jgi:hypothetical protein